MPVPPKYSVSPSLLGAAIALLVYFAYFVLRGSITDIDKKAKISAVYSIFAYIMLFPSIWILPRLLESLHPGKGGNPALNFNDLDGRLRLGILSCHYWLDIIGSLDYFA